MHLSDVWMIHHRQRLTLGFEASHNFAGVHADFDDLERDTAFDRLTLFGHVNDAKAAFPYSFQQLVTADDRAWALGQWLLGNDRAFRNFNGPAFLRRARSMRMRRIASAAAPKKYARFWKRAGSSCPTSRSHAACTSAVG